MPACRLAPGFFTPCYLLTTCECLRQCQRLRLPVHHLCFRGTHANGSAITDLEQIFSGPRYSAQWDESHAEMLPPSYSLPQEESPSPLAPPALCPGQCSGHGVCARNGPHCECPWAAGGPACESLALGHFPLPCYNGCSARGRCVFGECVCDPGFFGIDCSLFLDSAGRTRVFLKPPYNWTQALPVQAPSPHIRPLIYVYEMPPSFSAWQGLFSPDLDWREPVFFLERLLNSPHRTPDPDAADFFFLPLVLRNRVNNQEPLVSLAIEHVNSTLPFFRRSNGSDHLLLANSDWGACHLDGPTGRGFRARPLDNLVVLTSWGHTLNMEMGQHRACFRRGWDIAIPPEQHPSVYSMALNLPFPQPPASAPNRTVLLFFRGSSYQDNDPGPVKGFRWSLGARQELFKHFEGRWNSTGVLVESMQSPSGLGYLEQMLRSVFCFAPAGFGWAMRTTQAAILGCIPVVTQPNVVQAFEGDGVDWDEFAVFVALDDVQRIDQVLRALPSEEVRRKQEACYRVRNHFIWSSPNMNPLEGLPQEEQDKGARILASTDAFSRIMEALRRRVHQEQG